MVWYFVLATALIVIFGVEKGVERVSKVMMPILVVLTIGIAIYVITRPGASAGLKYYLVPDFSQLTSKTFWRQSASCSTPSPWQWVL